ncbi:MAG TPA: PHP domain-containing protein, partial [Sphingomonadales bacterium]|nr:PHP domain-containing protein [Sphingomonadales bacterium]
MFVHLRCHSHYSFLRAVPRPEEIIAAAAEQARASHAALPESLRGGAVALTDANGLYAAVPFYLAAREAGVKPIIGAVLDIEFRVSSDDFRVTKSETRNSKSETRERSLLLLAANLQGYSNLCRLVTQRQIDEKPVSLEALNEYRAGLIALCPVNNETRKPKIETRTNGRAECRVSSFEFRERIAALKDIFQDALYLEVQNLGPGDGRALREAVRLSRELGAPIAATNNVHFLRPEEHLHHRVLNAIRAGALLTTVAPPDITTAEAWFKSAEEMRRAFPDHPQALTATLEIAERCNLELPLGKTIFPEFPVPAGETPFSYLWKLCFEGARRRYQPPTPEVLARLT